MFDKILVANRGEIACRVMRTARRLGIRTVAVFSDADAQAMHVAMADEAYRLGPAPAKESYLVGERIVTIAKAAGAQAIHPGYGFLSENEDFAELCEREGVVFIGPPASAIRAMGSKSAAKQLMEKAGVPLVPGYHGDDQDPALLAREAVRIGFPVLLKASAGGGGKGMRIVRAAGEFAEALAGCKREALGSFGDDKVLIERYLERPRHIEIQVFADRQGNAVHLFERDCSVQRRHQKVLEEAPAPGMTDARRRQMGEAAVAAAKAIGYVGAGTVEFIADQAGTFHFMEMNTRLQVEHPVTEMITGVDLVEWQLRVADGESLPAHQEDLRITGHALEARIYAEDADRGFLPATGRIVHLDAPGASRHVRIDTGVRAGDTISPFYDPMIAKLIVWDVDRDAALARMRGALADYRIAGLTTNVAFLGRLVASRAFATADLDTGLIERNADTLFPAEAPASDAVLALAAAAELLAIADRAASGATRSGDPHSPWHAIDGWRMNQDHHHVFVFHDGDRQHAVTVHYTDGGHVIDLPHGRQPLACTRRGDGIVAALGDRTVVGTVVATDDRRTVFAGGERRELVLHDPLVQEVDGDAAGGNLAAPMPGKVIAVLVGAGADVEKGTPLVIMEAMKMEHTITAPAAGRVEEVLYAVGEQVAEAAELLRFTPRAAA